MMRPLARASSSSAAATAAAAAGVRAAAARRPIWRHASLPAGPARCFASSSPSSSKSSTTSSSISSAPSPGPQAPSARERGPGDLVVKLDGSAGGEVVIPSRAHAGLSAEYRGLLEARARRGGDLPVLFTNPGAYAQLDRLRARGPLAYAGPIDDLEIADGADSAETLLSAADDRNKLHGCLSELDERTEKVIRTAFFEGVTYETLARNMDAPLGTVKSWIRRGLAKLKGCLQS
mgnify:CR=1 FL=1